MALFSSAIDSNDMGILKATLKGPVKVIKPIIEETSDQQKTD